ncbi:MAG: Smr/MutS family protein [bacterium]
MSKRRHGKNRAGSKSQPLAGEKIPTLFTPKYRDGISGEERQLFLEAVESLKEYQGDLIGEKFDSSETRPLLIRPKRKSSSRQPGSQVTATLDLHGFARPEAIRHLERFCRLAACRSIHTLTVITGRGIHSRSRKPVLREEVIRWLNSDRGRKLVEAYRSGFPQEGGEGVLILYLHHPVG